MRREKIRRIGVNFTGRVQGVGFRPFVYSLARHHGLSGFVRNTPASVELEVEGTVDALAAFERDIENSAPPLSRIESKSRYPLSPRHEAGFRIEESASSAGENSPNGTSREVSPDLATCAACVAELLNSRDRRFGYAFSSCTQCGPRYTIVKSLPYDRERTTMHAFPLCEHCRCEFVNPADRRFHAQPIACAQCGPRLSVACSGDPLSSAAAALRAGFLVAIKGIGGFHLACDARDSSAVRVLRERKHRPEKPLAVMVRDLAAAEKLCLLNNEERNLLTSPEAPILLLQKRVPCAVAAEVAAGPRLGVFLAFSPLHHWLAREAGGIPLVMTSANLSEEAVVHRAEESGRLSCLADLVLDHDRPIHQRCDDSVARVIGGQAVLIRRSRGYAPSPIRLPFTVRNPVLAVGGQQKNTFALAHGRRCLPSHHVGDLGSLHTERAYREEIPRFEALFGQTPALLAHDLHPGYRSTAYAEERGARDGIRRIGVQHHHAHLASCMAENGLSGRSIGVIFDGTGYGPDGTLWGGEFLLGDYTAFTRLAHLSLARMPGGEQAIREPWRMAAAHLLAAGLDPEPFFPHRRDTLRLLRGMVERGIHAPFTSSVGRLFDAVAAITTTRELASFDGQAAMELEALAEASDEAGGYEIPWLKVESAPASLDTAPLLRCLVSDRARGISPNHLARRFHNGLARAVTRACAMVREATGVNQVALSGGVFLNAVLLRQCLSLLEADDFRVYVHRQVPPNDGGLSLGQAAVAAAGMEDG